MKSNISELKIQLIKNYKAITKLQIENVEYKKVLIDKISRLNYNQELNELKENLNKLSIKTVVIKQDVGKNNQLTLIVLITLIIGFIAVIATIFILN